MKIIRFALLLVLLSFSLPLSAFAQHQEPVIYTIKKGDTLWGLSDRFLKDPYYWPNLWARNPTITNPHLIYPGQQVKIYPDRIEIVPPSGPVAAKPAEEEIIPERTFSVTGAEGFLLETKIAPAGRIIATDKDRTLLGENDVVYTDIGRKNGAKAGDSFLIFKEIEAVSHPITHDVLGYRVASLGALELRELKERNSKAMITDSYQEIGVNSYLMPYREPRREVSLRYPAKSLEGYIVAARDGNISIGAGDIAYVDLGRKQGAEVGNLLYVVREIEPQKLYTDRPVGKLPKDVVGAVVIVDTGENTSAALVIKTVEAIHKGDHVEFKF